MHPASRWNRAITGSQLPLVRRHPRRASADPSDALVGPVAAEAIERGFLVGAIASAAEALGAASHCLDLAVDATQQRRQYGRAIGSFQALQHLLAELHVLRETRLVDDSLRGRGRGRGPRGGGRGWAVAKAHASRAAREIAEGALQVFGGVGFTWERDLHLLLRRPRLWTALWGCTASRGPAGLDS